MEEIRRRLDEARPRNWESWPALRRQWPWFAALGVILLLAIPWGIRAEERSLEVASRSALSDGGFEIENITFAGRQATIVSRLSTNEQNAAVNMLAAMGGVAKVTWVKGSRPVTAPTAPPVASTTTAAPEPGAVMTITVRDGRLTLRGIVPAAGTIREVADVAETLWGDDVVNQLEVDGSVMAHPWLGDAPDVIGVLTMLIDAQLTLDVDGATLTGRATSQPALAAAIARLAEALGPDIEIDNNVIVAELELPNLQILSPGDGTVALEGTVATIDVRKPIARAAKKGSAELELSNKIRLSETTADTYMMRRMAVLVTTLATADQWTLLSDGIGLGGSAVGGKAFSGNKVKPTAHMADLATLLGSFLEANPDLDIEIEVHADDREGNVDSTELAQARADAIAAYLVRLGIDPNRVSATAGAGDGELLRFQLTPADQ